MSRKRVHAVEGAKELVARFLDDLGAGIVMFVNAVAETHEAFAAVLVLGGGDKGMAVVAGIVDLLQHLDDGLVGPAVERSPQGANAGGGAGKEIGLAGGHHAHGGSGTILLVVGVKEEDQVERPHHFGL